MKPKKKVNIIIPKMNAVHAVLKEQRHALLCVAASPAAIIKKNKKRSDIYGI